MFLDILGDDDLNRQRTTGVWKTIAKEVFFSHGFEIRFFGRTEYRFRDASDISGQVFVVGEKSGFGTRDRIDNTFHRIGWKIQQAIVRS